MALSWILLPAFLFAILALSLGADPGAPYDKRRKAQTSAGDSNALQYPPQAQQRPGYSRDRSGHGSQRSRSKAGAGLLSHRTLHPLPRPEDDGTGLEGLSPVRVEMGPSRDRVRQSLKSRSQAQENQLLGTRMGRGNGHGNPFEYKRQGSRRDKMRHRKETGTRRGDANPGHGTL